MAALVLEHAQSAVLALVQPAETREALLRNVSAGPFGALGSVERRPAPGAPVGLLGRDGLARLSRTLAWHRRRLGGRRRSGRGRLPRTGGRPRAGIGRRRRIAGFGRGRRRPLPLGRGHRLLAPFIRRGSRAPAGIAG